MNTLCIIVIRIIENDHLVTIANKNVEFLVIPIQPNFETSFKCANTLKTF